MAALGRELLEPPEGELAVATTGLAGVAHAVGAAVAVFVQLEEDGTATVLHGWRHGATSDWGLEALPALADSAGGWPTWPGGGGAGHLWGGKLSARLAVAGVTVVPVTTTGGGGWALLLGWADRARIWDEGWLPLLTTAGSLLVASERLAAAEARPSVEEWSGVANRKLFLVLVDRMLARLDRARGDGLALLACQHVSTPEEGGARPGAELSSAALVRLLDGHVRDSDLVGRFDEQTVVLACEGVATPEDALAVAARLAGALSGGVPGAALDGDEVGGLGGEPLGPRPTWGVVHTTVRVAPGVLLRRADTAAYEAAVTGRGVALAEV